ncbi:MAG: L,D-transpeptidase family protein [Chloroflexota bacterium]
MNPAYNTTQPIHHARPAPPRRGRQRRPVRLLNPVLIIGVATIAAFFMLTLMAGVIAAAYLAPERIAPGVTVAEVSVGGMTADRAAKALQGLVAGQTITAVDGERSWPLALSDLGVSLDLDATLALALDARSNQALRPVYTIDLNQAQTALVNLSELANIDAVPGNPPQYGRALEIPVMLDRLRMDVTGELVDGVFELNMIEVEPPELEPLNRYDGATTIHVVERGQELALIAREYGVTVEDIVALNGISNPDLLYVGQELVIPAAGPYVPANVPPAPLAQGRSIVVSTADQRIYAYEDGKLVRTHLVSTGLPQTPTVLGDYRIYVKHVATDMRGPGYYLPQVPYTMYFYQGYGIHGTYWHNSFGRPMSHGCVNLPVDEAKWFFDFADVGTLVRVI